MPRESGRVWKTRNSIIQLKRNYYTQFLPPLFNLLVFPILRQTDAAGTVYPKFPAFYRTPA